MVKMSSMISIRLAREALRATLLHTQRARNLLDENEVYVSDELSDVIHYIDEAEKTLVSLMDTLGMEQ